MRFWISTWRASYQDLLCQIVDWISATFWLICWFLVQPAALQMLVGLPGLLQNPTGATASPFEQTTGVPTGTTPVGSTMVVGTTGNSQFLPPTFVGNTVLSSSVWNGLCFPREPA